MPSSRRSAPTWIREERVLRVPHRRWWFPHSARSRSMSTYTRGSFGGFAGRALAEGDEIPTAAAIDEPEVELPSPPQYEKGPVRIVPGPQDDYFTNNASEVLYGERFTVSTAADRVGIRLDGPRLEHSRLADIPSDGTV